MSPRSYSTLYQLIALPTKVRTSKTLHLCKGCRKEGRARSPESAERKIFEMSLTLDKFTAGQIDVGVSPSQTYLANLVCSLNNDGEDQPFWMMALLSFCSWIEECFSS